MVTGAPLRPPPPAMSGVPVVVPSAGDAVACLDLLSRGPDLPPRVRARGAAGGREERRARVRAFCPDCRVRCGDLPAWRAGARVCVPCVSERPRV